MSLEHDPGCLCADCGLVRRHARPVVQADRDKLAEAWAFWISTRDGEAAKLRAGQDGNPGSPRWVALQAIAAARIAAADGSADATPADQPNPIAPAESAAVVSIARPDGSLRSGQSTTIDPGA